MGDPRLQHIAENFDHMKRDLNDTFRFHCTQCGKCCINREDILMSKVILIIQMLILDKRLYQLKALLDDKI